MKWLWSICFISLLRWNFHLDANELWYTVYWVILMILLTNVQHVKYKKRLMQCYCGTDTSSTMDMQGLLETKCETTCLEWVSVYWLLFKTYHECQRDSQRHTEIIDWIAAPNNWNRTNVILKFSRACAGHCLVHIK